MATNIVNGMFESIEEAMVTQVTQNFDALTSIILPVWGAGVMVYFVVLAWGVIYGEKQVIMSEFIHHFIIISFVSVFMAASGIYSTDIVPFVMKSGQEIAGKLVGGEEGGSTGKMIDTLIDQVIAIGEKEADVMADAGWLDKFGASFMYFTKVIFLILFAGAFVVYATSYLVIAMVMVGILLSMGGVFIGFAAFPATRQMFTAWVGSCLNYIFLNISYAILFSILIRYINQFIENNSKSNGNDLWTIALIALIFCIAIFLLQQIATLMSILTGGVGINGLTGAVGGFVGGGASSITKGAGLGWSGAKLGGRGIGWAGSKAKAGVNKMRGLGNVKGG